MTYDKDSLDNPAYLAAVRAEPCCVCAFTHDQRTPTEAHHPIHKRYKTRRVADCLAIPLCDCHHTGRLRASFHKLAIHKGKESWAVRYGNDTDYIIATQRRIEAKHPGILGWNKPRKPKPMKASKPMKRGAKVSPWRHPELKRKVGGEVVRREVTT